MPQTVIDLLEKGVEANLNDRYREGNILALPPDDTLIVTGDLHGHRRNFERICHFSDLAGHPGRHVVLHEIIHGGPEDPSGGCLSYRLLLDAVQYKRKFPFQVHFVMGNHDTSFICDSEVMKDGKEMNRAMYRGLENEFKAGWSGIREAIKALLLSQPLAIRTGNRIWISHSLPSDRMLTRFDPTVFVRPLTPEDCESSGSAYLLTWGRRMSQATLDTMGKTLDVDLFILGHQPQPEGWSKAGNNLLIVASDHNHGCLVPVDLARTYSLDDLVQAIVPLSCLT